MTLIPVLSHAASIPKDQVVACNKLCASPPPALFLRPIVSFLLPTKLYQSYFLHFRLRFAPLRAGIRVSTIVYPPSLSSLLARFYRLMIFLFIGGGAGRRGEEEKEKGISYLRSR